MKGGVSGCLHPDPRTRSKFKGEPELKDFFVRKFTLGSQTQNHLCNIFGICITEGGNRYFFGGFTLAPMPILSYLVFPAEGKKKELRASTWIVPDPPARPGGVLPDSPPAMPHTLQLRDNCQACHTGPGSPSEIRTSHPDRANCQQCHVEPAETGVWVR